jgi:multidrug resistance efflux pump
MNPALVEPVTGPRLDARADASSRVADPVELARAQAAAFKRLLEVQAALVDARTHRQAAARLVERLAQLLRYDEVAVAFLKGGRLQDMVRSGGAPGDPGLPEVRAMYAAMHEALDQRASVATPAPLSENLPRIRAAQDRLVEEQGGAVACVLLSRPADADSELTGTREPAGVICVRRHGAQARRIGSREIAWLEHAAAFASPVLGLLAQRERSLRWRLRERWETLPGARHRQLRLAVALGGALAVAGLLLWPMTHEVGGRARVEGAVQRVVVAPAAGFLKQAHVRPGDTVKAGQLLVELAEEDLLLERERLASQSVQFESALAEANAKSDRAQVMIQLARLQQARAQLSLVESQLERIRLHAPFDAVVVQGDLSQRLGAPLKEGEELLTLAPVGRYRVIVEVDEQDIARVQQGQPGSLALAALPWKTLALTVRHVSPMASTVEGRNVFEVEAEVADPPAELRPGLSGSGRVEIGQRALLAGWATDLARALRRAWWKVWG